jgi:CheY-like chemotaxis protein
MPYPLIIKTQAMDKLILLIDDDAEELMILQETFELAGLYVDCRWACGCDHALQLLQEVRPDYIFLDYNMPGKNGLECLMAIRQLKKLDEVPVVMYSTTINENTKTTALQKGARYCLEKGGSLKKLAERLLCIVV